MSVYGLLAGMWTRMSCVVRLNIWFFITYWWHIVMFSGNPVQVAWSWSK